MNKNDAILSSGMVCMLYESCEKISHLYSYPIVPFKMKSHGCF